METGEWKLTKSTRKVSYARGVELRGPQPCVKTPTKLASAPNDAYVSTTELATTKYLQYSHRNPPDPLALYLLHYSTSRS